MAVGSWYKRKYLNDYANEDLQRNTGSSAVLHIATEVKNRCKCDVTVPLYRLLLYC